MYGLIIDNIASYIKEKYGESTWSEVKFVSGITDDTFRMGEKYSEGLPHKLIWACHDVTNVPVDELMTNIGHSFYKFLAKYEFNKVLRVLGRTFPEFLNGLDNLHEYLRFTFPKLKPPSFYCEHESATGLTLHYRSKRRGFLHYVQGQIRNIAQELFQTEVVIELLDIEHDLNLEHVIMRLHFNNVDYSVKDNSYRLTSEAILNKVKISSDVFFDIFPFIIVFNRGMRIRNIGIGLLRIMSGLVGKKINQSFLLMRPFIRFRWEEIMLYSNNIFELISVDPIRDDDDSVVVYKSNDTEQMTEERHHMPDKEKQKFLTLKGQMFYMEEWESICFVGIPVMSHLAQMYKSGLFINDFALHDSSRDLVLSSTQQAAELKLLLHQEAQKSQNMRENMNRLKKERKRADKLLYQMLPKSVANQLRNGESAKFESVTILFTDIVDFTKTCATMTPLEVINFLQILYTNFDKIIDEHGVYKVETIGDAYMVVSGAPQRTDHHAEFALDCATSFVNKTGELENLHSKVTKIDIRAGVHSGAVVAGVVGLSMPRYCLFGETVYIANHMEQSSMSMKILTSQSTYEKMEEVNPNVYKFEKSENVEIKDGQLVQTYFLVGKEGMPRVPSPRECESRLDDMLVDEEDDEYLYSTKPGRASPTTEAAEELKKKANLSYTPVSDIEIETYSIYSNLVPKDTNDSFADTGLLHLNISTMFYSAKLPSDNIHIKSFDINSTTDLNSLCHQMSNVSFIISICRSVHCVELVAELARISQVPTIQVDYNYWPLPLVFDETNNTSSNIASYTIMKFSAIVFHNVITDVFPVLDITPNSTVLYDNIYPSDFNSWRGSFSVLPGVRFVPMETTVLRMRNQITELKAQSARSLIIVAKTENVERFTIEAAEYIQQRFFSIYVVTNDITSFKCDSCESTFMFWLRPFSTGTLMEIRSMDDYLFQNEISLELDYTINGWDTLNVAFYMDLIYYAFETIDQMNKTHEIVPTFTCQGPLRNDINTTVRDVIISNPQREYGNYTEIEYGTFFQNIQVRIFKIDRDVNHEDAHFNKHVGTWTPIEKLMVMYGTLDVDVRNLNIYRVVTLIQPPFIQKTGDPNQPYEGYCIDLINLIKNEVNFTYTIYEVEDGTFGTMDDNGNWNGLIGALVSGSADIALAPLSVMAERENDVDFTVPYYDLVGTTILMKKADVEYSLFKFMKVLEWPVWLCIVAAYLLTSFLLWIFDRFSPYSLSNNRERYSNDLEKREFSLKECLWFCMTSLTPQGGGEAPKNISGRLVAATWWLFGFIIIASYTANLAAFLTVSRLEQPISSLDDLAKQYKIEYAPIKGSASETYFRRMAEIEETFYNLWKEMSLNESMSPRDRARLAVWDYPVSDKFTNMWRYMQQLKLPENMEAAIERVLNSHDGFAFIGDATEIKYAALTNCKLQQVGTEFSRKPYAIAVQSGHILKDEISSAILMLLNQRRLETLKEKWWTDNPNKVTCPDSSEESDGISIQNIGGVFIVILVGIVLSIITLAFEYYYYKKKGQNSTENEEREDKGEPSNGIALNGIRKMGNDDKNQKEKMKQADSCNKPGTTTEYDNVAFQY
ncbi:unnamed protein product [Caenorhabditis bovis]|uniref:guanylate cyclase n=1 Tax=Caenorhabditis bovis TaxID=2654633 RepID=A0A8S1E9P7_9PELO|nr:unnamed protein product [Caenorhabditis bovis]